MFGMMMNKSRRLLRRASTRENIVKKQRENEQLKDKGGGMVEVKSKRSPYSYTSQGYAVSIPEVDVLDSPTEQSNPNCVPGSKTSKVLTRSTSCTDVFFGPHFSKYSSLDGTVTVNQHSYESFKTSKADLTLDLNTPKDLRTKQNVLKKENKYKFEDFAKTTTVVSDQNISAGADSCTDLPYSRNSDEDHSRGGVQMGLEIPLSESTATHRIRLRFELLLPGSRGANNDAEANDAVEKYPSGSSQRVEAGSVVKVDEMLKSCEEKQRFKDESERANHSSKSTKTMLRSRSCSFIVSLSCELKDSVDTTNFVEKVKSSETKSPFTEMSKMSKENSVLRASTISSSSNTNRRQRSVRHFRRLSRSHSLLHFAGFTKDAQTGRVQSDHLPSGRKSTILENDYEINNDGFDDIFERDKSNVVDTLLRNTTDLRPLKQQVCASNEQPGLKVSTRINHNKAGNCSKCDDPHFEIKESLVDASDCKSNKKSDVTSFDKAHLDDPLNSHGDHKCTQSDCRQCQFISQFVVLERKPESPSSSRLKTKLGPRNQKINKIEKKVNSASSLKAIYLPTINFHQGRGRKNICQRIGSHYTCISARSSPLEVRACHSTYNSSTGSRTSPQTSRSQPPTHTSPKRQSTVQAKISTLTKALGIFAKRNDIIVDKTQLDAFEANSIDDPTINFSQKPSTTNKFTRTSRNKGIKQQSVDEIICAKLGIPFFEKSLTPKPLSMTYPETDLKELHKRDTDNTKGKVLKSNSADDPGKDGLFLHGVATSSKSRRTPISPRLRRSCQKRSGEKNTQNKPRAQNLVGGSLTKVSSFEDHKGEDANVSPSKQSQDNGLLRQSVSRRKNRFSDHVRKRTTKSTSVHPQNHSIFQKENGDLGSNNDSNPKNPTLQFESGSTKGFYDVLPPIPDSIPTKQL